jgi:hypothetical protein
LKAKGGGNGINRELMKLSYPLEEKEGTKGRTEEREKEYIKETMEIKKK